MFQPSTPDSKYVPLLERSWSWSAGATPFLIGKDSTSEVNKLDDFPPHPEWTSTLNSGNTGFPIQE